MAVPRTMTTVDAVVDELRERVRRGHLVPGQRLVESDLTDELGVSRGPLREALSRLTAEGLVVIEPFRGAAVRRHSRGDLRDLYHVRAMLEGQAAALAADRVATGCHASRVRMAEAAARNVAARSVPDLAAFAEFDEAFHALVTTLSGNALLDRMASRLRAQTFRLESTRTTADTRLRALDDHDAVADAILAGAAETAAATMRRHVVDCATMVADCAV